MRPVSGAKIGRIIDIRKFLSHRYAQKYFCKVTQISQITQIYFQSPAERKEIKEIYSINREP